MSVPAIHPGEHLAEELRELGMSAAELARNLHVPTNERAPRDYGRYGLASGPFLRHKR